MSAISSFVLLYLFLFPHGAYADTIVAATNFSSLVTQLTSIISTLVVLLIGIIFVVFMWGVIQNWIIKGGSEEGVQNGKKVVTASLIGIVVIISVWGIVNLLKSSFFGI